MIDESPFKVVRSNGTDKGALGQGNSSSGSTPNSRCLSGPHGGLLMSPSVTANRPNWPI
jgi:hypothetical protein